jgi:hypothetical protein
MYNYVFAEIRKGRGFVENTLNIFEETFKLNKSDETLNDINKISNSLIKAKVFFAYSTSKEA